jgi:hypothetical protein
MKLAYRRCLVSREESLLQDPESHRLLLSGTSSQGRTIFVKEDIQIIKIVYTRHAGIHR